MNKWVQLKDGVAFAYVESPFFIEGAVLLEEETSWDSIKAKKYENGSWVEAPLIYFVTKLVDGVVRGTNSTVFSSDVTGDIVSADVVWGWVKNEDGSYTEPPIVLPPAPVEPAPMTTVLQNMGWTQNSDGSYTPPVDL
jgi:hypothetical protein